MTPTDLEALTLADWLVSVWWIFVLAAGLVLAAFTQRRK